jgi:hypothetical protein
VIEHVHVRRVVERWQDLPRAVGRTIINDQDLLLDWDGLDCRNELRNRFALVEDGDERRTASWG